MSEAYQRFIQDKEKELRMNVPFFDGIWNKAFLYEYLVYLNTAGIHEYIEEYLHQYLHDEMLCKLLLDFLLDDNYDGSDVQMGAAILLRKFDRKVIARYKDAVLSVQQNEVEWKRPFDEPLDWLDEI